MSWLRRKGPSELEIAKENEIKRGITEAVSKALKTIQKENIDSEDRAVYSTETANAVCSSLEAVFLHGLRAGSVKKIANFVGLGQQDKTAEQSLNFWQFASKFTHGEVVSQLKHLGQITTEIGLCRAWVRLGLNDCLMESYVDAMTSDKKTLEYFYHRTSYLRDSEHPGILKSYLQGLMAFEFKLSYNSSVLNEWSYTPLILAGIIESDDSPLPVIKPAASKVLIKEPSLQENTSVEVTRLRAGSRGSPGGSFDGKDQHSGKELENPMDNRRLGQPSDGSYYVTSSEFTSQDVEEIKKLALESTQSQSVGSSSSHVSVPDPPLLNRSPSDYVQKNYRGRSHSSKSSKSNEFSDKEGKQAKDQKKMLTFDDTGPFKIDMIEEQEQGTCEQNDSHNRTLTNKYKPAEQKFLENLPPVKKVSDDFLKELYAEDNSAVTDSKENEKSKANRDSSEYMPTSAYDEDSHHKYKNYTGLKRMESINIEAKEDAILHDVIIAESESSNKSEKIENVIDSKDLNFQKPAENKLTEVQQSDECDIIEAFGEKIDLNGISDLSKTSDMKNVQVSVPDHDRKTKKSETKEADIQSQAVMSKKQLSPLTESNLKQLDEELQSIPGHIEEKITVDQTDGKVEREIKQTSPKRKSDKRRHSKDYLKPDFSPPNSVPLKPELSPAKAEKIDTFQNNTDRLRNHRLSLPASSLLTKPSAVVGSHRQSMPNILEDNSEVSHPVSGSYEFAERLHDIYDGRPIDDGGDADDDTVNEDEIPVVSNEPRQSVGNSLMLSGRGWSSSFDSEMNDTIEPLSPPRNDSAVPITTRPKADSFGTLLQNYTPSSSLSAPSIDDVLHNFPRTETVTVSPQPNSPMRSPLTQDSADEFEIVTDLDSPDTNMVARLTQLSEIANEKGLDAQNFQCKACARPLGLNKMYGVSKALLYKYSKRPKVPHRRDNVSCHMSEKVFGKPRVCTYDGGYYCFECHENDEYYIPARIVHNWDFRKHQVAKKNLEFLQEVEEQPHIDINKANPRLYDHVSEIQEIKKLRTQLIYLKTYLFTCKQSTAEDFTRLIWPRDYLCENVELYSLADLLQIPTGALAASLRKVIKFATKHVYSCRLCSQKGFICELCNNPKAIYAFEIDATYRCPQCRSVYHKECKTDNRPCPKCQRRLLREATNGLEPTSHDLASQFLHTR